MRLTLHCPVILWIGVYLLNLTDKLQFIKLQDNEELVSFDVSALFTSIKFSPVY